MKNQEEGNRISKKYRLLMLTTLIISGCSMCYELIISAVSSYLLGNSTLQYSITIGLYMAALGIGSYISKYFHKNLFNIFVTIELCIGIVGGMSSILLFLANIYIQNYDVVMYIEIITIGILAGAEIPIMTRIHHLQHVTGTQLPSCLRITRGYQYSSSRYRFTMGQPQ